MFSMLLPVERMGVFADPDGYRRGHSSIPVSCSGMPTPFFISTIGDNHVRAFGYCRHGRIVDIFQMLTLKFRY